MAKKRINYTEIARLKRKDLKDLTDSEMQSLDGIAAVCLTRYFEDTNAVPKDVVKRAMWIQEEVANRAVRESAKHGRMLKDAIRSGDKKKMQALYEEICKEHDGS